MDYVVDKFGFPFYKFCTPRFRTSLEPCKTVNRFNKISGHGWTEQVPKKNHDAIVARIEKEYEEWLTFPSTKNTMHPFNTMPRTIKETMKIQCDIDSDSII